MIIFSLQINGFCFIINLVFTMNKLQVGLEIISILNEHSYEAYIVGGAVRDYIRNKNIEDVDITTNATIPQIQTIFQKVTLEGSPYFSCRIHLYDMTFEVTTFRRDIAYLDHRHPVSVLAQTLKEDLLRRDFTMNALAMDRFGKITDLFHGVEDIHQGIIRMIGDPIVRFEEDALRVFRALIFSSRMNFKLDQEIIKSFQKDYIRHLKEEYVIEMLDKIMKAPFDRGLQYICEYRLLASYPFYQVLCEETLRFDYRKECYSLFSALHHFLPANLKISSKIRASAKAVDFWIRHQFDAYALYYGDMKVIDVAIEIYEKLTGIKINKENLLLQKQQLPIQSPRDIEFSWDRVEKKNRSLLTKKIEEAILLGNLKNEELEIVKYLEIEE